MIIKRDREVIHTPGFWQARCDATGCSVRSEEFMLSHLGFLGGLGWSFPALGGVEKAFCPEHGAVKRECGYAGCEASFLAYGAGKDRIEQGEAAGFVLDGAGGWGWICPTHSGTFPQNCVAGGCGKWIELKRGRTTVESREEIDRARWYAPPCWGGLESSGHIFCPDHTQLYTCMESGCPETLQVVGDYPARLAMAEGEGWYVGRGEMSGPCFKCPKHHPVNIQTPRYGPSPIRMMAFPVSENARIRRKIRGLLGGTHMRLEDEILAVVEEFDRASKKFPPMKSPHEGYAILLEEVEELWREVQKAQKHGTWSEHKKALWWVQANGQLRGRMRKEAEQVAAMAIRFLMDCCDEGEDK